MVRSIYRIKQHCIALLFIFVVIPSGWAQTSWNAFETYQGDTINRLDLSNKKQGKCIHFVTKAKPVKGYPLQSRYREGHYKDSRKTGVWLKYYPSGQVWSEINYRHGRAYGAYRIYHENGNIQEEGVRKGGKVTDWKRYDEQGKPIDDDLPQQQQVNTPSYGQEELIFQDSLPQNIIIYTPKADTIPKEKLIGSGENHHTGMFQLKDGYHKLYNKNKQISQEGIFKKGKLYKGKWYKYDENGLLLNIEIYRDGKYFGEAQIEDE